AADPLVIDRESPLDELYGLEGTGQPSRQFLLVFPPRVDGRAVDFGSQPLPGFQELSQSFAVELGAMQPLQEAPHGSDACGAFWAPGVEDRIEVVDQSRDPFLRQG